MVSEEALRGALRAEITDADLRDSTLQSLPQFVELLNEVDDTNIRCVAAIGSGKGALCAALTQVYGATDSHAVDIDEDALAVASERGLTPHHVDVQDEKLPFDDGEIDLVLCLGLLEHLTWYDHIITEIRRVVSDGGYCLFALPNMAGWTNRLSLLTGHQPRNVEFSQEKPFGILSIYGTDTTVSQVHAPTVGGFTAFLDYYGFQTAKTVGLYPYQRNVWIKLVDRVFSPRASLCRRFGVLAVPHDTPS